MKVPLLSPPKASHGDRIAIVSPSFAAPGIAPAIHEQALARLESLTGLVPVELPTTRRLGATARERAADIMEAFTDETIRAILATIGGDDQIIVIPHLDAETIANHPKPFIGYSDNTHLHHFLTACGMRSFYGGSTQVHIGPGPRVDPEHEASLRAALITGDRLEITDPGTSEDFGLDWQDPAALTNFGRREPTTGWRWAGPGVSVTGPTWGGCLEVLHDVLAAGRSDLEPADLEGAVLLIELSEEVIPTRSAFRMLRVLGEAVLPDGATTTFWGPGVSQGHSDALRRIDGVVDAKQYTRPVEATVAAVKAGDDVELTTRSMHTRDCYVVAEEGADLARIEREIVEMPNYFADYDTTVTFITAEELAAEHAGIPHGGSVIRRGHTSEGVAETVSFELQLDSNPEFTGSVLVATARAVARLAARGETGARTVFDVTLADLSATTPEDLRAHYL